MPRYEQGEFQDVDVAHDRNLQGTVTGRVVVRAGAHLLIQGHFGGDLHVENGGLVTIQGSAHGQVAENDGLILLSGETDWAFSGVPGRVAVCNGSVLTGYGHDPAVLRPDGTVGSVPSGSININAAGAESYCYFDRDERRFIPMSELGGD